jgi:acyl-CoA synthetase (AMP-forming)/AMP-acid ligase II
MNPESGVYDLIGKWAALQPRSAAVSAPGGTWIDYGGLKYEVDEIGKTLGALGIRTSDRVAVMLPNGLEMAIALLGVSAWAASAPLNAQSSLDELDFYFADLKPRAVIVPPGVPANVRAVAADHRATLMTVRPCGPVAPFELAGQGSEGKPLPKPGRSEAIALVLHTSGTTSRAKLVPLSHRNLLASARNTALALQLTPQDRCLNLMPLFHTHGIIGALLSSMTAGASIVCTPGFQAENVLRWLGDCEPTWYTGVPAMHEAILNDLENRTDVLRRLKLRFVRTSSAPLRPSLLARLETVMHVPVFDSYGLTEASQLTSNPLPPYTQKPGSVGLPSGPEIVVVDANGTALPPGARGEVVVRGANVIAGYASDAHNRDSFRDGWLRTGDEGYFDSDGYLFLTGRLKEIINRGGEKICPREIDEVLLEHADVTEAAAFGIPHPSLGEDIAAAVVLKPGACQDERALEIVSGESNLRRPERSFRACRQVWFPGSLSKYR